jgi:WD repeat-containing protein 6
VAAEGPCIKFFDSRRRDHTLLQIRQIFKSQVIHGISVASESPEHIVLVIWGGSLLCALEIDITFSSHASNNEKDINLLLSSSPVIRAPDWIFDLSSRPSRFSNLEADRPNWICAAVTARNSLIEIVIEKRYA